MYLYFNGEKIAKNQSGKIVFWDRKALFHGEGVYFVANFVEREKSDIAISPRKASLLPLDKGADRQSTENFIEENSTPQYLAENRRKYPVFINGQKEIIAYTCLPEHFGSVSGDDYLVCKPADSKDLVVFAKGQINIQKGAPLGAFEMIKSFHGAVPL